MKLKEVADVAVKVTDFPPTVTIAPVKSVPFDVSP
jgi:hypothetical protein